MRDVNSGSRDVGALVDIIRPCLALRGLQLGGITRYSDKTRRRRQLHGLSRPRSVCCGLDGLENPWRVSPGGARSVTKYAWKMTVEELEELLVVSVQCRMQRLGKQI